MNEMKLSEEVRQLCIPEPGQWWLVKDKLAARIAALESDNEQLKVECNELSAELSRHCGCEFDPETANCVVKCLVHERVEAELAAVKAENERLRDGLQILIDSATPWIDGRYTRSWEVLSEYSRQLIEPV